jgi:hypothetical protein
MTAVSTVEAAKIAHVSVRQLHRWTERGYLHPAVEPGPGQGYKHLLWYSADIDDAEILGVISRTVTEPDFLERFARALKDGPTLTVTDHIYEVVVTVRPRS